MEKVLVVVLGMHRSGTSATTRALEALGVELGTNLLPAAPDNERGFFEDLEVNALNVELLRSIGHDWHTPLPISQQELSAETIEPFKRRACEILKSKLDKHPVFGLKDPRFTRLLPFWKGVFAELAFDVRYVIAVRNPLSVAQSLMARDRLPPEKAFYLWLGHVIPSILETTGSTRLVVDYDHLLDDPHRELQRMQRALRLGSKTQPKSLQHYKDLYLARELRHSRFHIEDLVQETDLPPVARDAFSLLSKLASDDLSPDDPEVREAFESFQRVFDSAVAALGYIVKMDNLVSSLNDTLTDRNIRIERVGAELQRRDDQVAGLQASLSEAIGTQGSLITEQNARFTELYDSITERDRQLAALSATVAERDERIASLHDSLNELIVGRDAQLTEQNARFTELYDSITERDRQLAALSATVAERDEQVTRLHNALAALEVRIREHEQAAAERANQIAVLAEAVSERNKEIATLSAEVSRRDSEMEKLRLALSDRETRIQQAEQALQSTERELTTLWWQSATLTQGTFWRLTKGVRRLWNYLEHEVLKKNQLFELSPLHNLQRLDNAGMRWKAVGDDPHFAILPSEGTYPSGWVLIKTRLLRNSDDYQLKLYFDLGAGMSEANSVILPVTKSGTVFELVQFPQGICGLRWDPMNGAGDFTQDPIFISRVGSLRRIYLMLRRTLPMLTKQPKTRLAAAGLNWQRVLLDLKGSYIAAGRIRSYEPDATYARWIALNETGADYDREQIVSRTQQFGYQPLISVVVPVFNTLEPYLRLCLESVLRQSYPHWELCIADDASSAKHVRKVLEEFAARDSRIRVTYRMSNGHISEASNSALAISTGDYVALLDHDDELAEHALYFVVEALNANPEAQVVYSDEDKIDEYGVRFEPHFKCDWNPDLFFSQNYVSHLGVYRRALLERINGFRKGVEGSQDQDLLLRCLSHVKPSEIVHIPKVLYHWRILEGSTALASGEKSYTTEAGIKALKHYFTACEMEGVVVEAGVVPNTYRVRYPIPQPQPLVSLIIPTRDRLELLEPCVRSILDKTTYQNYEIIILDNESVEPATLDYLRHVQIDDVRVRVLHYHHPFNYSAINNYGVQHARGELIGLINNDIEVISPEWLTEMVSHGLRPEIGCVGAKLYYEDDTVQHAGVILGIGGVANHSHKNFPMGAHGYFARLSVIQNYSAVTAACLLVRKTIYEEVGGLEEEYLKVAFNDVDFCLKVQKAGYRNLWTPYAELYHYESKSRGTEDTPEKRARFISEVSHMQKKWKDRLLLDPMYSPNLTREKEDFSISHVGSR